MALVVNEKQDVLSPVDAETVVDYKNPRDQNDEAAAGTVEEKIVKLHPDGGWGWMVVLGSALAHFLVVGLGRSFGLFYLDLLDRFQQSAFATSLVVAIHNTTRQMLGPVTGVLSDRFTCQKVVIAGGLLMCVGCVISAFATSLLYLYITFSALAGIGGALVFTPSYVIVGQYFDKKKGKAMGFSTIGSGFGTVALAPIITALLREYSYFGAMFIMGAIMLNNCVSGALYRPLPQFNKTAKKEKNIDLSEEDTSPPKSRARKICSNLAILGNVTFLIYGFQITAMSVCIQTYLTFLPGIAKQYGASANPASFLLSVVGIADMVSRFAWGFFFDLKPVRYRRRLFHALLGIPVGGFAILNGFMFSYIGFLLVTILFGLVEGGFHSQRATIVSEFVPKDQMSSTVGFVIAFQGIGNMLGPPVGGLIRDATGSYNGCYYFAGVSLLATSSLFILNYFYKSIQNNNSKGS